MAIGSNVNPNYPIPGLDQSSKGFRDNFAIIKQELESLQGTTIQLVGAINSEPYAIGSSESIAIDTVISGGLITLTSPNKSIQYNNVGVLTGNVNFVYDQENTVLGIGTSVPNPNFGLDVKKSILVNGSVYVQTPDTFGSSNIILQTGSSISTLDQSTGSLRLGSVSSMSFGIYTNATPRLFIDPDGNTGIATQFPNATFHIESNRQDVGYVSSSKQNADNLFKFSTSNINSTIGIGLEHSFGNWLGGMRIASSGHLTLHTGENALAYLSTSSAKLSINTTGKVGIGVFDATYDLEVNGQFKSEGITDDSDGGIYAVGINQNAPAYTLDVVGDIASTGAAISTGDMIFVDTTPVYIDSIPMSDFRTAKYLIQIVNGTSPSENVNVIECLVTHANDTAYLQIVGSPLVTGSPLGPGLEFGLSVSVESGAVVLKYTGSAADNRVKLNRTYITN